MTRPSDLPEWASDPITGDIVEPSEAKKDQGWSTVGGVPEKPAYQFFNWWMNNVYSWLKHWSDNVLTAAGIVSPGDITVATGSELKTDTISEKTSSSGVNIDGVLLKDNDVTADEVKTDTISENTSDSGVIIDGVLLKDNEVTADEVITDTISENTPGSGVTIDGVLLKDNEVTADEVSADFLDVGSLFLGTVSFSTISSGELSGSLNSSIIALRGEGGAADDLDTIDVVGYFVVLKRDPSVAYNITIKNGTGNLYLSGSDFVIDNDNDCILLVNNGDGGYMELTRSNNG